MNTQFLEYVRQQLIVATADLSGATKGQLMAWLENAQFDTGTFKRKKPRVLDEVTGEMITLDNPPIPGKQSHAKGSHIPLVQPVEYSTASWRRALMTLEEHQKAWLLWNYSENVRWDNQVLITQWGWQQFSQQLAGKRVAKKTIDRLRQLIWLAAQDVKKGIRGGDQYSGIELAELTGVEEKNWYKTFGDQWQTMQTVFESLDRDALLTVSRSRSQQKATNFEQTIAKVEKIAHI
ncbi:antiterminator [Citrobacter sp. RHBSTW-00678]|uniref:Q antiterminator encoded by prophage CP-933P n=1 Tax=Citrobacter braakii TaxID=57706 RepID=A0AAD1P1Y5_CITBR|nr:MULTISPECIES: bacteriophage antitermination protein Q [Citrobacter]AUV26677.1 antiterminator [Citrobacter freundii complex sp. CFNIH3]MBA7758234.1 antiterminator [Citrobacter sp. RHBSTW-00325]MBA8058748.1 antiterminator [Citrobacter sp. RHBSTW-00104]POV68113.1 antiterminator [Citrobacter freundii complex sp. CFNIH5]QLR63230.1 antiterminator [Citrobacter sp. RHBSTW-00976]